ncbi:hypothetical protein V3C99_010605 [Haemonchus contortus]|uniref:Uncharacterized protein n=1 Tax=Haemonchus contortus TaxID=6289 RepID=A0A7I4Y9G2_HAECO
MLRHPGYSPYWKDGTNILKGSQRLRDRLLDHMRAGRLSLTKDFVHSYARTDYTKEELAYDRSLRQKAGIMNREEEIPTVSIANATVDLAGLPRILGHTRSLEWCWPPGSYGKYICDSCLQSRTYYSFLTL